jgi:hypothetical protein
VVDLGGGAIRLREKWLSNAAPWPVSTAADRSRWRPPHRIAA